MYKKQKSRSNSKSVSIFRTKRFSVTMVLVMAFTVGTFGTYFTIIGPRLRARGSAEEIELVDQKGFDDSALAFAENSTGDSASTEEESDEDTELTEEGQDSGAAGDANEQEDASLIQQEATTVAVQSTQSVGTEPSGYTPSWGSNVLSGRSFYLGSHNPAKTTADSWRATRPTDAAYMDVVAAPAKGIWLVMGLSNISSYVSGNTNAAAASGKIPIFVLYGMPTVGCGGPGSAAAQNYLNWVDQIDAAITKDVVIIVEPDELPLNQCGGEAETGREQILKSAVTKLSGSGRYMYIDAGHGSWVGVDTIAARLQRVGVEMTQGFSLNVSNYTTTAVNTSYGNSLSAKLGGAHFVIDTSRNGLGPDPTYEWCNAPGRALGELPKTYGASSKLDALMWAKYPGESDGSCNGGPSEGAWWPEYALDLAKNAD